MTTATPPLSPSSPPRTSITIGGSINGASGSSTSSGVAAKHHQQVVVVTPQQPPAPTASTTLPSSSSQKKPDDDGVVIIPTTPSDWKKKGNDFFASGQFELASQAYQRGLQQLLNATNDNIHERGVSSSTSADDETAARNELLELRTVLYSNRAMALIKLQLYDEAQVQCNIILDELQQRQLPKVWYRRALARQGQASQIGGNDGGGGSRTTNRNNHQSSSTSRGVGGAAHVVMNLSAQDLKHQRALLQLAKMDLMQANKLLLQAGGESSSSFPLSPSSSSSHGDNDNENSKDQQYQKAKDQMYKSIQSCLQRVDQSLADLALKQQQHEQALLTQLSRPSPQQQWMDVLKLLQSSCRESVLLVDKQAFFLLDWNWWCTWCQYVQINHTNTNDITSLLLPGAVPPQTTAKTTSTTKTTNEQNPSSPPPGPIDNSSLLLPGTTYCTQWYKQPFHNHPEDVIIKPQLVRGYHYEIVPREVYFALKSWYGEITPSICRRASVIPSTSSNNTNNTSASSNGTATTTATAVSVCLYPLQQLPFTSKLPQLQQHIPEESQCAACGAPDTKLRCTRCTVTRYCDRECQGTHWPYHQLECPDNLPNAHHNSRPQCGLNNLGNTCFMNASLQALRHVTPLSRHFLSNQFQDDVNVDNPLGTSGRLAHAYCTVLKELYMSGSHSTSPTALKRAIAIFAPRFAGCLQHDAQEFLAFLLDGLHEDLNRIQNAPYVELPDVDETENMKVAGARAWEAHLRRNDSLVLDCFYGQFKSTCVCPQCQKVSVSFDAFNHVSLEIPQQHHRAIYTVVFFPSSGDSMEPIRHGLELPKGCSVSELKAGLSTLLNNIPTDRLAICEIIDHEIGDLWQDSKLLHDPQMVLFAYDVDPFSSNSFHAIASHQVVLYESMTSTTTTMMELSEEDEQEGEVGDSTDDVNVTNNNGGRGAASRKVKLGFPFMVSFPSDVTCRQAWEHVWKRVSHMVEPQDSALLRIVIRGKDKSPIFPNDSHEIPSDNDDLLATYLDKDALDQFVLLTLEWHDPALSDETETTEPHISEERFLSYHDHSSWMESMENHRTMSDRPKGVTLNQCFETFTKPERLDEQNMWYCSRCKEHVRAMKTMELWRLPNILVVHLKRFEFKHILRREKLDTLVDFPLDGLDMGAHCSSSKNGDDNSPPVVDDRVPAVYDLFGVVNHYGRMGFGHYTAFARSWDESSISDNWTLFDDSSTRTVDAASAAEAMVAPAAYVLFYRRRIFH